jgi:hypothetical protein
MNTEGSIISISNLLPMLLLIDLEINFQKDKSRTELLQFKLFSHFKQEGLVDALG